MPSATPDPMAEIFALFKVEGKEHLDRITELLLELEKDNIDNEGLEELFRAAHSLKGAASTLGVDNLAAVAHAVEDVFGAIKRKQVRYDRRAADAVLGALDVIADLLARCAAEEQVDSPHRPEVIAALRAVLSSPPPAEEQTPAPPRPEPRPVGPEVEIKNAGAAPRPSPATIRVPVSKLNSVVDGFADLLQAKGRLDVRVARVASLAARVKSFAKRFNEILEDYKKQGNAAELATRAGKASLGLAALDREMRGFNFDLEACYANFEVELATYGAEVERLRMAPLAELFGGLKRPARDLAVRAGKQIDLVIVGEDNELDKTIIERLRDPLNHLIRNAVDHGIEPPEARVAAGKPPAGRIEVRASRFGSSLQITVKDDGRGIDADEVRRAAAAAGVITAEGAAALEDKEALRLVFEPGVTTRATANEFAGRGVGMDVVASNVAALGGWVEVEAEVGRGTTFDLYIPVSLSTMRGLLVLVGDERYILPLTAVLRVDVIKGSEVETVEGKPTVRYRERYMTLGALGAVLGKDPPAGGADSFVCVFLNTPSGEAALVVSEVLAEDEYLVKDLGLTAAILPFFAGAHVTGDGNVTLIVNADAVVRELSKGHTAWRAPTPAAVIDVQKGCVLVVDDSLTTRILEKNILEAAGYRVVTATNGDEALKVLASSPCDLAVVDVQMPRMDGFEFTRRLRSSADYRDLPVILVTSLDTAADVARGLEAGADAYVKKSEFDQRELLTLVERLM